AERPAIGAPTLGLGTRLCVGALPDARQILARDALPRIHGLSHDVSTDDVVDVALKAALAPRYPSLDGTRPAACAPCALRGLSLYRRSYCGVAVARRRHVLPAEALVLTRHGDVRAPQVN